MCSPPSPNDPPVKMRDIRRRDVSPRTMPSWSQTKTRQGSAAPAGPPRHEPAKMAAARAMAAKARPGRETAGRPPGTAVICPGPGRSIP